MRPLIKQHGETNYDEQTLLGSLAKADEKEKEADLVAGRPTCCQFLHSYTCLLQVYFKMDLCVFIFYAS